MDFPVFDTLSDRLSAAFKNLRGKGKLTDADIEATTREIRIALLEADVALPVVREFIAKIQERASGAEVRGGLNPAQQVIKIVNEELVGILGGETRELRMAKRPPTVIMLAGLQGAGKTTLAGKLAKWLKETKHQTPMLVAADLQRPNAVTQLQVVGERAGVPVFAPEPGNGVGDPVDVARQAMDEARTKQHSVVIVDTAGRLGVDEELMKQAADIRDAVTPDEILFVVDAMIGQDAVTTAQAFLDGVGFDGVVLSKLDGDARGGAALSIAQVTGRQVMFASNGEKLEDFDVFHPDRMASRILGMGDVMSLIEQAERSVRRRVGRQDRRQAAEEGRQGLHPGRLPRPDAVGAQDGPADQDLRHAARRGPVQGPAGELRRARDRPDRGGHPLDDAGRADRSEHHQRLPPGPDREGVRDRGGHRQRPGRAVLRGPQDDVRDGVRQGHAGHARDAWHAGQGGGKARPSSRRRRASPSAARATRPSGPTRAPAAGAPAAGSAPGGVRRRPERAATSSCRTT